MRSSGATRRGSPRDRDRGQPPIGRDTETTALKKVIDALAGQRRGGALFLHGDPGIGKTVLLDQACFLAIRRGIRVLRAAGAETEMDMPFVLLADLLRPLRQHAKALTVFQQEVLEAALEGGKGAVPTPLSVCSATLAMVTEASAGQPVVLVVDDLHWADPASTQVLRFLSRRLGHEPVALLSATREPAATTGGGSAVLDLHGLGREECGTLLAQRGIELAPGDLTALVRWCDGNPLAVVEAGARAADASTQSFSEGLSPGEHLQVTWAAVLRRLPADTQWALAMLALDRSSGADTLQALASAGVNWEAWEPAVRQALVTAAPEGNTFTFRHPLIRTVVLHAMEPGRRQRALVRLADVSTISRAVWYREAGAVSQDEELAQLLAETAEDASRRGAYHSAACAWQAAAQRGEAEATRTTRLTRGAEAALLSGDPAWASRLARDALDLPGDTGTKTAAQLALGRAYTWIGRPELAFSVLTRSATLVRRELPDVAETMMREAILPMVMSGNAEKGLEALESWLTSGYDGRVDATASLLGPVLALRGHVIEGARALEQYQDVVEASDPLRDGLSLCLVSQGYIWLDRPLKGRRLLQSVIAAARTAGSLSVLPYALALHSELDIWEGRWAVASADALEALRWAREFGMPGIAAFALSALARLDALRGSRAACAQRIEQARQLAGEAGMWALEAHFAAALGLDCLASGELASAIDHLSQASAHEKRAGIGNPMIAPHLPDLAEAHVRAGSVDAPYLLERLEAAAESTRLAWMQAAHARCRMLAAQSAKEVDQWWFLAHAAHSRRGLPYEEARTLLCRGEALRRQRVAVRAREPLLEALSKFVSLGAQPWAARTRAELRAAGYRGPDLPEGQASEALGLLTGQELQVARAVARGLSNAEVAACLFISQKTVEAHLTRVYRKLRTRSRAELAGRLRTLIE